MKLVLLVSATFLATAFGVPSIPGLKECAVAQSGKEPCWELADPTMTAIPTDFLRDNTDLTGTLKLGAAVKTIGNNAFRKSKLTGLDLSDATSLVSIGHLALAYTGITGTLVIPANVETIGYAAFTHAKLTSLDLSNAASLVSIGAYAFEKTDITGTLKLSAAVKTIGKKAFLKTKLTGLDMSDAASLVSIDAKAFRNTRITATVETPFNVPTIGSKAFPKGVSIVKVSIPGLKECAVAPSGTEPCWELADPTMTAIPTDFLRDNTDLTGTLKLGAAVKTIGDTAFYRTKLTGLDLTDATSLVSIGNWAFWGTDITGTLVVPAKVETIGNGAFYQSKLAGLDLSNAASLESIGVYAFLNTLITGTIETPFNVPSYTMPPLDDARNRASFPSGVTIVKG